MNENDLERRLRSVVSGQQPPAPPTLRRFLHGLPETQAGRGRWGVPGRFLNRLPAVVSLPAAARRFQVAGGVALALVIAVAGAGILLSLRQGLNQPLSQQSPTPVQTGQGPAPRPTSSWSNVVTYVLPGNPYWYGLRQPGTVDPTPPVVTATSSSGTYFGISAQPYGKNGLVRSEEGLFWEWSPVSDVDPALVELTSIAGDATGRMVVVGSVAGPGGARDGRAYLSSDGNTWLPASDQSVFAGTPIRTVVHGPRGFIALGWNEAAQSGAAQPVTEWLSESGLDWTRVSGVPVQGSSTSITATADAYVLSGTPLTSGTIDQPPFWYSLDGRSWQRATTTDHTAQKLGPLASLTVTTGRTLIGLSKLNDGSGTDLGGVRRRRAGVARHRPDRLQGGQRPDAGRLLARPGQGVAHRHLLGRLQDPLRLAGRRPELGRGVCT